MKTSQLILSHQLQLARGETLTVRLAHGPGMLALSITGILYDARVQPRRIANNNSTSHRYTLQGQKCALSFSVYDCNSFCHKENAIYLKER